MTRFMLHLTMEELSNRLGVKWLHVPYKGSADATVALRGGQVQAGTPSWAGADYAKWARRAYDGEKRAVERLGFNK